MKTEDTVTPFLKQASPLSVAQARDLGVACFFDASNAVVHDNDEAFDARSERLSERAALMNAFDLLLVPQSTFAENT
jgi:hypothetical protein